MRTKLLIPLLLAWATAASGATYYVDPATGANTNDGDSVSTPWKTPPGTRNTSDSGFISSTWAKSGTDISTSNKVACGDLILLKGGSTQTSTHGGRWQLDTTYYTDCTTGSRTTIRVASAAEWTGSAGNFVIDGTSMDISGYDEDALVAVDVDYLTIGGISDTQRLEVKDIEDWEGVSADCTDSTPCVNGIGIGLGAGTIHGVRVQWAYITNSVFGGVGIGLAHDFLVTDTKTYNNGGPGFLTGEWVDRENDTGALVRATSDSDGARRPSNYRGNSFYFNGSLGFWCVDCTSIDAAFRGTTSGVMNNANLAADGWSFRYRNFIAYGSDMSAAETSGDQWQYAMPRASKNFFTGAIAWNNGGTLATYGGGYQEVWHATMYYSQPTTNEAFMDAVSDAKGNHLLNSISDLRNSSAVFVNAGDTSGCSPANTQGTYTPACYNNCLRPISANSERLGASCVSCSGSPPAGCENWPNASGFTYTSPPSWITGKNNQIGTTACDPQFVATSTSSWAGNDFHLQATSTAIDAGKCFFTANGGGTGTQITSLTRGGPTSISDDPRNYFISPASYLDATGDEIIVGGDTVTITALTATSISFTPQITWADGDCIHLKTFTGSNSIPEMGAYGYSACHGDRS